jgi:hypothetical protein
LRKAKDDDKPALAFTFTKTLITKQITPMLVRLAPIAITIFCSSREEIINDSGLGYCIENNRMRVWSIPAIFTNLFN